MKNKSEKILVIVAITILLVTLSIIVPIKVKGDNNDAGKSQVLSGKTFTNGSAVAIAGQMKNFGGQIPEVTATAADEDYIATIDLDDGYYESVKINAKPIYDAGVASGKEGLYTQEQYDAYGTQRYNEGKADGKTTHTATYTFVANDTGGTKDLGVNHSYRYVNATNVYNKGKADGQAIKKPVSWSYYLERDGYNYLWGDITVGGTRVVNFNTANNTGSYFNAGYGNGFYGNGTLNI